MKRLYFLLVALLLVLLTPSVRASWVLGDAVVPSASLKTGQYYVIESASTTAALGMYLQADNSSRPTVIDSLCVWELVSAGQNAFTKEPAYYLKNIKTGKYLSGAGSTAENVEDAYAFVLHSSVSDPVVIGKDSLNFSSRESASYARAWTENSTTMAVVEQNSDKTGYNVYFFANYWSGGNNVWSYRDTNPWNFYEVTNDNSAFNDLQALVDEYDANGYATAFTPSDTKPFCVKTAVVQALTDAYEKALDLLGGSPTDDECREAEKTLRSAIAACQNSANINPLVEGYYYIKTANSAFTSDEEKAKMAWYLPENSTTVSWIKLDENNKTRFLWHITPTESGNFMIQNMANGYYIDGPASDASSQNVVAKASGAREIVITDRTHGQISLAAKGTTSSYRFFHQGGHGGGAGTKGSVVTWSYGLSGGSSWTLDVETDQDFIAAAEKTLAQNILDNKLSSLISEANNDVAKSTYYKVEKKSEPIITEGTQFSCNNPEQNEGMTTEQMYANLIDGNYNTYMHSAWSSSSAVDSAYHYLQVETPEAIPSNVKIYWAKRWTNNNNRPTVAAISVSTDGQNWTTVDTLRDMPTSARDSFYVSKALGLPEGQTFLRLTVVETSNNAKDKNGFPFFTFSEFNLFTDVDKVVDASRSQSARPEVAAQINVLQEAINKAKAVKKGETTQDDIDALQKAIDGFDEVWADSTDLVDAINTAIEQADNAVPGDEIGFVPESAIEALRTVAEAAQAKAPYYNMTAAQIAEETQKLNDALKAFARAMVVPTPGVWYNIVSNVSADTRPEETQPTRDRAIYAGGYAVGDEILWGNTAADNQTNARSGWTFIDLGNGTYGVQNVGSGWYMGQGGTASTTILLSDTIVPYEFAPLGNGEVALRPVNNPIMIHAQWVGHKLVNWNSTAASASSWVFEEVDKDAFTNQKSYDVDRNYIVTVPFTTYNIPFSSDGVDVTFYTLTGATRGSDGTISDLKFSTVQGETLEPGVPYLMAVGPSSSDDVTSTLIDFAIDNEVTTLVNEAKSVNGLQGALTSVVLRNVGKGYFTSDKEVQTTDGENDVTIAAQEGYIVADDVKDVEGATNDLTIQVAGEGLVNKIQAAQVLGNEIVNVYTIDGVLVKKNVKAAAAVQGLQKGIYVVGKKKVLVK